MDFLKLDLDFVTAAMPGLQTRHAEAAGETVAPVVEHRKHG